MLYIIYYILYITYYILLKVVAYNPHLFCIKDAVVAEVTGNGDVAKVENGEVKPEVFCMFWEFPCIVFQCKTATIENVFTFAGHQWRCGED